jgi:hypothetical protein
VSKRIPNYVFYLSYVGIGIIALLALREMFR